MSNSIFHFKQFDVHQEMCAMKVSTDAILFGSWAKCHNARNVLDIGTGTGILALMMAQKNPDAAIDAIEIDADSLLQAKENFARSKWNKSITAIHTSLQRFTNDKKYDVIISNPPYFINQLKAPDTRKSTAKHTNELSYQELVSGINRLLHDEGCTLLMLPYKNFDLIENELMKYNLFINETLTVFSVEGKTNPYLVLSKATRKHAAAINKTINIRNSDMSYSKDFRELTKEFYLSLK